MNSHSSGCTERVMMSRWSWRSLRSSACAIASVPSAIRANGPVARTLGAVPGGASVTGHGLSRDGGRRGAVRGHPPASLARRALLAGLLPIGRPVTAVNTSSRLSASWRSSSSAGSPCSTSRPRSITPRRSQWRSASSIRWVVTRIVVPACARSARRRSHTIARASGRGRRWARRGTAPGAVEQRGGDLQAAQHAARERAREPVEHLLQLHRLDRLRRSARAARVAARPSRGRRSRGSPRR